jgi:hypothetical protein
VDAADYRYGRHAIKKTNVAWRFCHAIMIDIGGKGYGRGGAVAVRV